ncbi:MAG: aminopeptidase [Bacilli bacterium]|nr:aminopeptidase [Bacilli bacterium]MBR6137171.1 aminopeptidase [Bacilli bacterium]
MIMENVWKKYNDEDINKLNDVCDDYRKFISISKIEREVIKNAIAIAENSGFVNLDVCIEENRRLDPGDKIYVNNRGKSLALFIIGREDITNGINILGAHVDSPRLDLKANPLYEDSEFAYLDTHYYGGIKKYQWVTIPLALHGVVVKKNGEVINVVIGEDESDPVVGITDLLPHLGSEQMKKEASKVIEGEGLDVLIGSMPIDDSKDEELVKKNIMQILKNKYYIEDGDFLSAEIEVVPAGKARDFGLDRSMIMAYGQDDKVCAYASLRAFLDCPPCDKTISCILVDKEEIGSVGATGMQSTFYENAILEMCNLMGHTENTALPRTLTNSYMLSSDVNAAYDPLYADVMDKRNASYFNQGVVFCKYTGSRGKSGSNDANAEFVAKLRNIMDNHDVHFQISELGKVDAGGGGTIAYILANKNVNVIDCGVGVLSMHAPWEVTAKSDIYEAYKCYVSFLQDA